MFRKFFRERNAESLRLCSTCHSNAFNWRTLAWPEIAKGFLFSFKLD